MIRSDNPSGPDRLIGRVLRELFRGPLIALASAEGAALLASPLIAYLFLGMHPLQTPMLPIVAFATTLMMALIAMGLHSRRQRARFAGVVLRVLASLVLGGVAFSFIGFLIRPLALWRSVFVTSLIVAFVLVVAVRFAFEKLVDEALFKRRIIVYGAGRRALGVAQLRRRTDTRGFRVLGYIASEDERVLVEERLLVAPSESLLQSCIAWDVDEIVIAMDDRRRAFPVHELLDCRLAGIIVTEVVDFLEAETGRVRLDVLNPSWIIFAPGFSRQPLRQLVQRLFDVAASLILLVLAWPVMLIAAIAVKIEDGWRAPVFYGQTRVGLEGRPFLLHKFRSMRVDAESGGKAIWAQQRDSRVTRIGAIMRKTRIDELPQLLNVLRGDMSFVGPRPERPEFVAELENRIPYYRERHAVKPGITGWAQLCYPYGSSEQDAAEKLQYDLYYVKNHSFFFDLMILVQTAEVVLWGKGAR